MDSLAKYRLENAEEKLEASKQDAEEQYQRAVEFCERIRAYLNNL